MGGVVNDPFDVAALFRHRAILEGLDRSVSPAMVVIDGGEAARSVALLPGSFNPPTSAHLLLAERARADGYEAVVPTIARETVGKGTSGLILEDRLLAMRAACGSAFPVAVCSHGLYADQADAAARAFPGADLALLVGSDKVFQILDERWYDDRDAALDRLFSAARLVVAPRADQSERLRDALAEPRTRRWADRVEVLRLHPAVNDLSSTRVRGLLRAGADPAGLVPPAVAAILNEVRAFAPPGVIGAEEVDPYALRASLVDLLWRLGAADADLRALLEVACADGEEGRQLRARLRAGTAQREDLERATAPRRA